MRNIAKWYTLDDGTRAGRFLGKGDVRGFRPIPHGYECMADLVDVHPVSGQTMDRPEWWIFLTKERGTI